MITTASVEITKEGAVLTQSGKELEIENLSIPSVSFSVISLDPPPHQLDRTIEKLKRLELRVPAYIFRDKKGEIKVRLSE